MLEKGFKEIFRQRAASRRQISAVRNCIVIPPVFLYLPSHAEIYNLINTYNFNTPPEISQPDRKGGDGKSQQKKEEYNFFTG